jgi:hypothetical protein
MIDPTLRWQNGEKPPTGIALRRRGGTATA